MNSKQNMVFFIGLILIIMVFWAHGYWHILYNGIFTGNLATGITGLNPDGGCPKGYKKFGKQCLPPGGVIIGGNIPIAGD